MSQYQAITIDAPAELEDELTMLFFDQGAAGVAVEDPAIIKAHLEADAWDASVFDAEQITVGRIKIAGTLTTDEAGQKAAQEILAILANYDDISIFVEELPDIDWQTAWRESFVGHPIGNIFWLRPYWESPANIEGRLELVIEPSLAFGTGDHPTTAMMLELIEDYLRAGQDVIDLGCGSGILAIAGLILGARKAIGIDIDPICEGIVARHCELNGLEKGRLRFYLGNIISDRALLETIQANKSQLILANITADIICRLCPLISDIMTPDGVFLCSGIIKRYDGMVEEAFVKANLRIIEKREEDDWLAYAVQINRPNLKQATIYAVAQK